jgi:hypothetical protein
MGNWERLPALLCGAVMTFSCSGGTTSSQGNPPTPLNPLPTNVANLAGKWVGTLESSNFSTRTISLDAVQGSVNCVDGAWASVPAEWAGAISGLTGTGSFSGLMSFEGPSGCSGVANIAGDVGDDTLTWSSTGFTASNCTQGTPQSVVLKLKRQSASALVRGR